MDTHLVVVLYSTDVISVDGPLHSSTVVSTVTAFGIGRRTDVDGIANGFVMTISHGQNYGDKVTLQVGKM